MAQIIIDYSEYLKLCSDQSELQGIKEDFNAAVLRETQRFADMFVEYTARYPQFTAIAETILKTREALYGPKKKA